MFSVLAESRKQKNRLPSSSILFNFFFFAKCRCCLWLWATVGLLQKQQKNSKIVWQLSLYAVVLSAPLPPVPFQLRFVALQTKWCSTYLQPAVYGFRERDTGLCLLTRMITYRDNKTGYENAGQWGFLFYCSKRNEAAARKWKCHVVEHPASAVTIAP